MVALLLIVVQNLSNIYFMLNCSHIVNLYYRVIFNESSNLKNIFFYGKILKLILMNCHNVLMFETISTYIELFNILFSHNKLLVIHISTCAIRINFEKIWILLQVQFCKYDFGCSWLFIIDHSWSWLTLLNVHWSWFILVHLSLSWCILVDPSKS